MDIIKLELLAIAQKYEQITQFKKTHSDILRKLKDKLEDGKKVSTIRLWLYKVLQELYAPVRNEIDTLSLEHFELGQPIPTTKLGVPYMMGMTINELINSRIKTHFRDLVSQYTTGVIETNKSKKRALNATTGIYHDSLKVCREQGYDKRSKKGVKGWQYIAMLDRRTSGLCISLNGRIWLKSTYGSRGNVPYTPNVNTHPRCRSILVEIRFSDTTNHVQTLDEFIDDDKNEARKMMGEKKYKLFIDGNLSAKDVFNPKGRKFLTNQEIQAML